MAIASLVLGILWLSGIGSLLALIFGFKGKKQIDQSQGAQSGRGLAVAGIVLGFVGVGLTIIFFLFVVLGVFVVNNNINNQGTLLSCQTDVRSVTVAAEAFYARQGSYPSNIDQLVQAGYLQQAPHSPDYTITLTPGSSTVTSNLPGC